MWGLTYRNRRNISCTYSLLNGEVTIFAIILLLGRRGPYDHMAVQINFNGQGIGPCVRNNHLSLLEHLDSISNERF